MCIYITYPYPYQYHLSARLSSYITYTLRLHLCLRLHLHLRLHYLYLNISSVSPRTQKGRRPDREIKTANGAEFRNQSPALASLHPSSSMRIRERRDLALVCESNERETALGVRGKEVKTRCLWVRLKTRNRIHTVLSLCF